MHLASGELDLDKLEASLKRKTAGATGTGGGGGGAKTLKWLKDTSAAPKSTMGRADEQRAQMAAAAAGAADPASSAAGSVRSGSGGAGGADAPAPLYSNMIGGPGISPSVHIKQPVLKSLRNTPGAGVEKSSMSLNPNRAVMIEVLLNDRLGKKVRVKVNSDDTILTLKKLAAAQLGTKADKIRIQKCEGNTHTDAADSK